MAALAQSSATTNGTVNSTAAATQTSGSPVESLELKLVHQLSEIKNVQKFENKLKRSEGSSTNSSTTKASSSEENQQANATSEQ